VPDERMDRGDMVGSDVLVRLMLLGLAAAAGLDAWAGSIPLRRSSRSVCCEGGECAELTGLARVWASSCASPLCKPFYLSALSVPPW
jgi:hypothetical protein